MNGQATHASVPAFPSLRERVLRAGGWSLAGYVASQLVRFGTNLLMTRLLAPEMFGVMAIALMVMIGLALFSDLGLRQSVVQSRRGIEPAFLDTAWTVQILRGICIAACAALGAGLLALAVRSGLLPADSAYAAPELPLVIAVLGLGAILGGFESTKVHEAARRLELARITLIDLVSLVTGVASMIALAQVDRSVWVLVSGSLVTSLVRMLLTHTWLPGVRNQLRWERSAFREILGYGKWIFVSSIVGFVAASGDRILLGGLIDARLLGVYSIALLLFNAAEQTLGKVLGDVTFPALSEVARQRRKDLRRTVYRFHLPLAVFAYGSAGVLLVAAPSLVSVLYDPRYHDAGWILQILAAALVSVPARVHAICLLSLGQSRRHSLLAIAKLITLAVSLPIAFHLYGLPGAVWAVVLSHLSIMPLALFFAAREGFLAPSRELLPLPALPVGAAVGFLLSTLLAK
jgi:O-antigen/teichoic acid export membrane protein